MVVLSLAIGLAEQDDFASLPDLQEVPPSQETPADKRYWLACACECVFACEYVQYMCMNVLFGFLFLECNNERVSV